MEKKIPAHDKPIPKEEAKEYREAYLNDKHFKPSDFIGFYLHRDEIKIVLEQNLDMEYVYFSLGRKPLKEFGDKVYGCGMMQNANLIKGKITLDEGTNIYDLSHPVPPYPPED
jgi:hypothetical protein